MVTDIRQRLALVQVLRKRFSKLTFDDLRQILTSPLGKGLGPMLLAEVFVAPEVATAAPTEKPKTPKTAPARKKKSSSTRKAAKKRQKPGRPQRARPAKATADQTDTTATPPTSGRKTRRQAKSARPALERSSRRSMIRIGVRPASPRSRRPR